MLPSTVRYTIGE